MNQFYKKELIKSSWPGRILSYEGELQYKIEHISKLSFPIVLDLQREDDGYYIDALTKSGIGKLAHMLTMKDIYNLLRRRTI